MRSVLPEVVLLAAAVVNFAVGPFLVGESGQAPIGLRHRWGIWSLMALGIAGWLWLAPVPVVEASHLSPFQSDALVWFVRMVTLVTGAVLVLVNWNQTADRDSAESQACLLLILAGANLISLANDLVVLFLALELVSIPTYVFLYWARRVAWGQ